MITIAFDGTTNHLRRSQLKDFGKGKKGNPINAQIKGMHRWNIPIGRLGNQMSTEGDVESRNANLKMMLKDLITRPTILTRFGKVNVLAIG
jgi:hypothetical protein